MSLPFHNSPHYPLYRWTAVLLAIVVCAGCQTRVSQVRLGSDTDDPIVQPDQSLAQTIAKVEPEHSSTNINESSSTFADSTPIGEASPSSVELAQQPLSADGGPKIANVNIDPPVEESEEKPPVIRGNDPKPEIKKPAQQPPRVVVKKPVIVERDGKTYQPYHLNKNQTLLLLAAQPDIRSRILASTVREVTTPEQQRAAEKLAATFDQQYVEILRQRTAILESAVDGVDIEAQLLDLRMTTADLTARVRTRINEQILTQEQRFELQRLFEESQK